MNATLILLLVGSAIYITSKYRLIFKRFLLALQMYIHFLEQRIFEYFGHSKAFFKAVNQ